ncbi:TPA: hypothetical protein ACSPJ7_003560 [Bacillus cereus]
MIGHLNGKGVSLIILNTKRDKIDTITLSGK